MQEEENMELRKHAGIPIKYGGVQKACRNRSKYGGVQKHAGIEVNAEARRKHAGIGVNTEATWTKASARGGKVDILISQNC